MHQLPLTDCHAHLTKLSKMPAVTVARILCQTTREQEWAEAIKLANTPGIFCALGVHPFCCDTWCLATATTLETLLLNDTAHQISAIGEIGLDTLHTSIPLSQQLPVLAAQLQLALQYHRPVCLHLCHVWEPFFQLLSALNIQHLEGYCHSFTGSADIAQRLLRLGLHLSFGKSLLQSPKTQQIIPQLPVERLLTETDCPDMLDEPTQAIIPLEKLASLKHLPNAQMARQIAQNFAVLFGKNL